MKFFYALANTRFRILMLYLGAMKCRLLCVRLYSDWFEGKKLFYIARANIPITGNEYEKVQTGESAKSYRARRYSKCKAADNSSMLVLSVCLLWFMQLNAYTK